MATLAEVRLKELESLAPLRAANESKLLPAADCGALKACVCQKSPMGAMRQCELCRDAFHSVCVRGQGDPCESEPWLCPLCRRSAKPALDRIVPLMASLQRIRVRLPEGDALRYMIERTVDWQRRAREVIASYNLPTTVQEHQGRRWAGESSTKVGVALGMMGCPSKNMQKKIPYACPESWFCLCFSTIRLLLYVFVFIRVRTGASTVRSSLSFT